MRRKDIDFRQLSPFNGLLTALSAEEYKTGRFKGFGRPWHEGRSNARMDVEAAVSNLKFAYSAVDATKFEGFTKASLDRLVATLKKAINVIEKHSPRDKKIKTLALAQIEGVLAQLIPERQEQCARDCQKAYMTHAFHSGVVTDSDFGQVTSINWETKEMVTVLISGPEGMPPEIQRRRPLTMDEQLKEVERLRQQLSSSAVPASVARVPASRHVTADEPVIPEMFRRPRAAAPAAAEEPKQPVRAPIEVAARR